MSSKIQRSQSGLVARNFGGLSKLENPDHVEDKITYKLKDVRRTFSLKIEPVKPVLQEVQKALARPEIAQQIRGDDDGSESNWAQILL